MSDEKVIFHYGKEISVPSNLQYGKCIGIGYQCPKCMTVLWSKKKIVCCRQCQLIFRI